MSGRASMEMASLRDAGFVAGGGPVVSLRSTTGYRLASLRDMHVFNPNGIKFHIFNPNGIKFHIFDPNGIKSCSRWLSAATPPDTRPITTRTPAGVPFFWHRLPFLRDIDIFDPNGIKSCSRWLSAATPPDTRPITTRTPAGVPSLWHRLASLRDIDIFNPNGIKFHVFDPNGINPVAGG